MFNNYNGRRASRGEKGMAGGSGNRIKLREKERARKVDSERELKEKEER